MLKQIKQYSIHLGLFLATLFTTTLAGSFWIGIDNGSFWATFCEGFRFSIPFLAILTAHEFGHYFTARYYKVKTSLPYFLPIFIPASIPQLGTFGAFIRMEGGKSRKELFDIGIAGPLAGFIVALGIMFYGFTNLPPGEYVFQIHPDYKQYGLDYSKHVYTAEHFKASGEYQHFLDGQKEDSIAFEQGKNTGVYKFMNSVGLAPSKWERQEFNPEVYALGENLLFLFFKNYVADPSRVPNKYEMFHYPWLLAAYFALFFTALNLLPIGQLDGGHVIYGLFGQKNHSKISPALFSLFVLIGGIGLFKSNLLGVNYFESDFSTIIMFSFIYLYFLYYLFSKTFEGWKNILMVSVVVFASQFVIEFAFPNITGFSGWLLFAFILGRFLGVHHPSTPNEEPLDLKRKILGWITLVIFILCFTPEVLMVELLK